MTDTRPRLGFCLDSARAGQRRFGACAAEVVLMFVAGCGDGSSSPEATSVGAVSHEAAGAVTLRFEVEGMHCTGCARGIEGTVAKLPGVRSCAASFEDGEAVVQADDASGVEAIAAAIEEMGYTVRPVDDSG